jgi:signal transduction histidine kinase
MIAVPVVLYILFGAGMSFIMLRAFRNLDGDTGEIAFMSNNLPQVLTAGLVMLTLLTASIVITNRILTKRTINSIVTPLNTLSFGVGQIRDGNLNFRLEYIVDDEFAPICADFNQMAERLQYLENTRQKDEESRRELIAGISHDLRTPLTAIKAYVEGLEKGVAETPEQRRKYFDTIKDKTEDLEHIIGQLFLFSKLETNEFPIRTELVDIGQEISETIRGLSEEYAHKGLTLKSEDTISGTTVNTDTVLLRSVLVNILENSAKYKIGENGTVSASVQTDGEWVLVRLSDDGPGVPKDALPKLFDVFYRNDPSRNTKGSGLGLAISAKIIERMGGKISAELPAAGGLAVIVRLPAVHGERTAEK